MQFVSFSLCSINLLLSYIIIYVMYVMYNVYGICWRSDISLNLYVVALKAQGKRKRRRTKYEGEIHKNTFICLKAKQQQHVYHKIISYAHSYQHRFEPFYRSKCLLVVAGCRHDICNNINSAFPVVTLESQVNDSTIFYVLRFVFYFAERIIFFCSFYI